jgi:hypothetical protein
MDQQTVWLGYKSVCATNPFVHTTIRHYLSSQGGNLLLQNSKTALVGRLLSSDLIIFARRWDNRQEQEGKEQQKQTSMCTIAKIFGASICQHGSRRVLLELLKGGVSFGDDDISQLLEYHFGEVGGISATAEIMQLLLLVLTWMTLEVTSLVCPTLAGTTVNVANINQVLIGATTSRMRPVVVLMPASTEIPQICWSQQCCACPMHLVTVK